jgi:hypothetical protein
MKTLRINSHKIFTLTVAGILALAHAAAGQVTKHDVHLEPQQFTLYCDPYNGNQIKIGGFSGICPVPGRADRFYIVTDRGPAPDFVDASGHAFKTFATPAFGPHVLTVDLQPDGKAKIRDVMPLRRPNGTIISGLPTSIPATDVPYDFSLNQLPFDEDSLDAEGITIDPWGNFWVCEEYKPSVAMISPDGTVLMRLVPSGTVTGSEQVPTYDLLPSVLAKRRNNRGLEGIAASPDGILYTIMQRPLNNPNRSAADANGNVRIFAINLNTLLHSAPGPLIRQYLYRIPTTPNNVTLSDLFVISPGKLLVPERATDKLYVVDVAGATDLTPLENPEGKLFADPTKTIEQLNTTALATNGIIPVTKTIVLESLTTLDPLLEKVEGVCVVGGTLVLTYDNDFNVAETASIPAQPNAGGPFVQLELLGTNYPRIITLRLP